MRVNAQQVEIPVKHRTPLIVACAFSIYGQWQHYQSTINT